MIFEISTGFGQTAPVPHLVEAVNANALETKYKLFDPHNGERTRNRYLHYPELYSEEYSVETGSHFEITRFASPGAPWLRFRFEDFDLGEESSLTIRAIEDDAEQHFTQKLLEEWNGYTMLFNGDEVEFTLFVQEYDRDIHATPVEMIVGEQTIGEGSPDKAAADEQAARPREEIVCGADGRNGSKDPRVGRLMMDGCTVFIIEEGMLLSAGHCDVGPEDVVQFNVPPSTVAGVPRHPKDDRDQYTVLPLCANCAHDDEGHSSTDPYPEFGDDWAVFLARNSKGEFPKTVQSDSFKIAQHFNMGRGYVTGFGVDMSPPERNQVQQRADGRLVDVFDNGSNDVVIKHTVDTMGGNSGSPIVVVSDEVGELVVGVHNGGYCGADEQSPNFATSLQNSSLWEAIEEIRQQLLSEL